MNYLETWIHSPFAKALGWSLIHFLWEGALIALLLGVLLFLFRNGSARLGYALACLALLAMPLGLGLTLMLSAPSHPAAPLLTRLDLTDAGPLQTAVPLPPPAHFSLKSALPWLPLLWMAGVLIFYVRSVGGWIVANRLRRAGVFAASSDWQARLERLCGRMGISKPVTLLESCLVEVPVIMGFVRPVVLMPMGLVAGLSTDQLESILIHELAHIRRWDYVVNLLQNLVEGLLFYHPAVWWVSGQIRSERENCCDDVVVDLKGDARGYAAALATLERNRWPAHEPALAATGGSLMKRIRRLLREPEGHRASAAPVFLVGLLVVSVGVAVASWQAKAAPAPKRAMSESPSTAAQAPRALPGLRSDRTVAVRDDAALSQSLAVEISRSAAKVSVNPRAPLTLLAQAAPPQDPRQTPQERISQQVKEKLKRIIDENLQKEADTPYRKWLKEDVAYIIADEERAAYKALPTDEEREKFIEQFWLRRDPTPGTPENEFRQEHYRRIAYSNEHFSAAISGWKTDRGRIYITYGPPDEIESHPSGGTYKRPPEEGGDTITAVPFEQWRYRYIEGIGTNVIIEFIDPDKTGEFRMTTDPNEKDAAALNLPPGSRRSGDSVKIGVTVQVLATAAGNGNGKAVLIMIPLSSFGNHAVNVLGMIVTSTRRPVQNFEHTIQGPVPSDSRFISLAPGSYRLTVVLKDIATGTLAKDEIPFEVK